MVWYGGACVSTLSSSAPGLATPYRHPGGGIKGPCLGEASWLGKALCCARLRGAEGAAVLCPLLRFTALGWAPGCVLRTHR